MWVNRGMPPFDPSRLTPRQKDELIRDLARLVAAQAGRIAAPEARLAGRKPAKTPPRQLQPAAVARAEADQTAAASEAPAQAGRPRRDADARGRARPHRGLCHARACAHRGTAVPAAGQRLRHADDHLDLPPIRPVVTRVRIFGRRCPACRRRARGAPPAALPPGSPFGPSIVARLAYPHHHHAVGYDRLSALMAGLFGLLRISGGGAIANALRRAHRPLDRAGAALVARLRRAAVIGRDETGARPTTAGGAAGGARHAHGLGMGAGQRRRGPAPASAPHAAAT